MKKSNKKIVYILIGVATILLLWIVASAVINSDFILPYPWVVASEFFALFSTQNLYIGVFSTALRALLGFLVSAIFALLLAVLSYIKPALYTATSPIVTVLRAVPTMSVILLFFIWFSESVTPAVVGFLISFPLLYENFHTAISGVDKKLLEMSKIYGVKPLTRVRKLFIPLSRDGILSGLKSGISLNLKVVISAEIIASTVKSLGFYMQVAQTKTAIAELFAWTLFAVLLSFLFEGIIELIRFLTKPKRTKIV